MANATKSKDETERDGPSIFRTFWSGFFWPLKQLGRGLKFLGRFKVMRFVGRLLGFGYLRGSWLELKQVTWPTRREGLRLTSAVIIFSIIFGALIAAVDYGLDKLFKQLILK